MRCFTRGPYTFDIIDTDLLTSGGDTVVLLHGFPQDSSAWSNVTPKLNEHGLRCIAPNLRGYSAGARPRSRSEYRMEELVADVLALLDSLGVERVHLVGHDWGGAVAWVVARVRPQRIASLTVLSTPHPDALRWAMTRSGQALRSWYMFFMQLPVVPELLVHAGVRAGYMRRVGLPPRSADAYERRLSEPDAVRGAVNWYRGMFLPPCRQASSDRGSKDPAPRRGAVGPVRVPTTFVWGRHDPYLGRTAALRTRALVHADYRFVELDAGHWLPECHPQAVAEAIIDSTHRAAG